MTLTATDELVLKALAKPMRTEELKEHLRITKREIRASLDILRALGMVKQQKSLRDTRKIFYARIAHG